MTMIRTLTIKNMLNIRAMKIEAGRINKLTGGNGSGKSNVLNSINRLLVGGGVDPSMITTDQKKGEVLAECTGGLSVGRTYTEKGGPAKVKQDGERVPNPAKFLGDLINDRLLKPVEWVLRCLSQRAGDQRTFRNDLLRLIPFRLSRETLTTQGEIPGEYLAGLDFDQHGLEVLSALRKRVYETRHHLGQDLDEKEKAARNALKAVPPDFDPKPHREASITDLSERLARAREHNRGVEAEHERLEMLKSEGRVVRSEVESLGRQIKELQAQLEAKTIRLAALMQEVPILAAQLQEKGTVDTAEFEQKIADYKIYQRYLTLHDRAAELRAEANQLTGRREELTELHDRVRDELPKALLEKVPMPIKGLRFVEDTPYIGERALRNLSTGELFRVAFQAAVRDGHDRGAGMDVVLIDDYEHLDSGMQAEIDTAMAEHPEIQFWYAVVGEGDLQVASQGELDEASTSTEAVA